MNTRRHHRSSGRSSIRERFVQATYAEVGGRLAAASNVVRDLVEDPPQLVAAEVTAVLEAAVANQWDKGWQPADLTHAVGVSLNRDAARLAGLIVTSQSRSYEELGRRVAPRWLAQVDDLEAAADGSSYLWEVVGDPAAALSLAISVHGLLLTLPPLPVLTDPPTAWSEHGPTDSDSLPSGILTKVRALLAKAESTTFDAEAEALTAKAQELMTRYRVDRALLDRDRPDTSRPQPAGRRILIDNPYADAKATLLSAVADPNGCRAVWAKPFRHCTLMGFPDELDAVDELFTSLLVQAEHALLREGSKQDAYGRSRTKQFRRSFLVAFAHRIGQRLRAAVDDTVAAASVETGTALVPVLTERRDATDAAVTQAFPRLGTFRQSVSDEEGWQAGTAFADRANLTVSPRLPRQ
jgi:hypothetical protein